MQLLSTVWLLLIVPSPGEKYDPGASPYAPREKKRENKREEFVCDCAEPNPPIASSVATKQPNPSTASRPLQIVRPPYVPVNCSANVIPKHASVANDVPHTTLKIYQHNLDQ